MEAIMRRSTDLLSTPALNYEQWRDMLRPNWGLYTTDDPKGFVGRVRTRNISGFNVSDISNNVRLCERTQRDVRLDGVDHYYAVFQIAGRSTILQNDRAATLSVGDVTLIDSARPVTYLNAGSEEWLSLQLPRQPLKSHLGFEPLSGFHGRHVTWVGRLLYQLIRESAEHGESSSASPGRYMQLAIYDLIGALFAPSDTLPVSPHTDKLFRRVCDIIKNRFADPDFGPCEVAIEAGISLRYLQKLFYQRSSTCSQYIYSLRLDHATRLLLRRKWLRSVEPVSEVAYASGFRDYTHFARKFRHRFGHSPSSYKGDLS
jgi:AraC-like DNA-binding protein